MNETLPSDHSDRRQEPTEPKNYIEALTAPGAKFDKTKYTSEAEMYEAIAKGKYHADSALTIKEKAFDDMSADYIQLREQMNTQASLQELMDRFNQTPTGTTPQPDPEVKQPSLDPKELETLLDNNYRANKQRDLEQANFDSAKAKLTERYGVEYAKTVAPQLEELNISPSEFEAMARKNPKLFEKTFLPPRQTEDFQNPIQSTNRITSQQQKRTWSYYEQMKKDTPRVYSDPKTQLQMMKDYEALGNEFEDGTFHKYR